MTVADPHPSGASGTLDEPRAPTRRLGLVLTVAFGVLLALGAFWLGRHEATERPPLLVLGEQAPAFALTADDGSAVALAKVPGVPTIVAFVETGCSSCQHEAPLLADLARHGARVVAVDVADGSAADRGTFAREDLAGLVPIAGDPTGDVPRAYRALVVPTVYVVRADGTIADAWSGRVPDDRYAGALATARG